MKNVVDLASRFTLVVTLALAVNARAENPPIEPFQRETLHRAEARIEAVDKATRTLSFRSPQGLTTIAADPAVRNFDSIRVGDKVRVSYYEAIAAEIKKKDGASNPKSVDATAIYRAPEKSQPAAALGRAINATVKIESIDPKANTIMFRRSDKSLQAIEVESPEGHKFLRTLHPGDEVEVMYVEALAVEVVPTK